MLATGVVLHMQQEQHERAHSGADGHDGQSDIQRARHGGLPPDGAPRASRAPPPGAGDLRRLQTIHPAGLHALPDRTHPYAGICHGLIASLACLSRTKNIPCRLLRGLFLSLRFTHLWIRQNYSS